MKKEYENPILDIIYLDETCLCDMFGSSEYGDTQLNFIDLFDEEE